MHMYTYSKSSYNPFPPGDELLEMVIYIYSQKARQVHTYAGDRTAEYRS